MGFLRLLESVRVPALDTLFSGITYFGDELAFLALALLLFWCVDKRTGYYVFVVGLFGTLANQFLKITCRIPRPWVLDPDFTIVEAARAAATGDSFPSGHTQNAVGTFGAIALQTKQRWVRWACIALVLLVPVSRMYLGVHTPLDVGVAFLMALALLAALYPVFRSGEKTQKAMPYLLAAGIVLAGLFVLYVGGIRLSRATLRNIHENLFWAFFYNTIGIPIAAGVFVPLGLTLNPMIGAAAMSLSSFCVVTNALRLNLFKLRDTRHDHKRANHLKEVPEIKEETAMKKTIQIEGMMCAHCEATVKKALEALPEVTEAEVSHTAGTAVVTLSAPVDDAVLKSTVEAKDYKVTGIA